MSPQTVTDVASQLVSLTGRNVDNLCAAPCPQGGNNRLWRIECASGRYAAKSYFRHPADPRDRLATESSFLAYAREVGLDAVPDIIGCDTAAGIAVHEWIDGVRPGREQIGARHVLAAARFFRALNHNRAAAQLPLASEASFSISQALERVDLRLPPLLALEPAHALDREALLLIQNIARRWIEIRTHALADCTVQGIDPDVELAQWERCISPSDFGFHNALETPRQELRFVDFEYAGWDDPAKMMADFFCQPALPVPLTHWNDFAAEAFADFAQPQRIEARARILLPAYRLRWCCIALNIFSPVALARRRFADPGFDELLHKRTQLELAHHLFAYSLS
jgi:hypothetical protein